MPKRPFARHLRRWLPIVALIPFVYLLRAPVWTPLDNRFYNYFHSKQTVDPWNEVVVVGIDDRAVEAALQRPVYPLSRHAAEHAEVVRRLHESGARAIVLDLRLTEEDFEEAPSPLARAMQDAGNVYLAMSVVEKFDDQGLADVVLTGEMPHPVLVEAARGVLVVQVEVDPDGVLRRFTPDSRLAPLGLETLAEHLAGVTLTKGTPIIFPSLDTPLPYISYADVIERPHVVRNQIDGRIAFVGSILDESTDYITVPRAQRINGGRPVFRLPGVGALAAATETLIKGSPIRDANWPTVLLWNIFWSVLAVAIMPFKRPVLSTFILIGVLAVAAVSTGLIHVKAALVLPAGLLFGCVAACGVYTLVGSYVETTKAFYVEEAENRRVQNEMRMARATQERFLPDAIPAVPPFDIHGVNVSSLEVSGDYYDVISRGEGRVVVAIGDVKGKGMPASLLMSNVQAGLHTQLHDPNRKPEECVTSLNELVFENTTVEDFVTFALIELHAEPPRMSVVRAGHELPFVIKADGEAQMLEDGGPVLGLIPNIRYEATEHALEPGDVLCVYTDGVTEACDPSEQEFGSGRLIEAIRTSRDRPAREVVDSLVERVREFSGLDSLSDDVTVVVVRVQGQEEEPRG